TKNPQCEIASGIFSNIYNVCVYPCPSVVLSPIHPWFFSIRGFLKIHIPLFLKNLIHFYGICTGISRNAAVKYLVRDGHPPAKDKDIFPGKGGSRGIRF
ncbi:MAG: hypothetical protein IKX90_01295, partial [Verrucomicrobia bacterium]|nr:hypothetical protein [Verrucomicrobiota bacterium]